MDILTHTVSGLAVGALAAGFSLPRLSSPGGYRRPLFSRALRDLWPRAAIVAASGLGGALPDIDAATWLLGDGTYSGRLWYSHHGFFHSFSAAVLFALLIGLAIWVFGGRKRNFGRTLASHRSSLAGFVAGFVLHLLEDMPTPASTWGGVRMLFPSSAYVGGTGQIWWWNNYDIFLIACAVFVICAALMFLRRWRPARWISLGVFALGCALCAVQVHTRYVDYAYTGHTDRYAGFEASSKAEQRRILGPGLFRAMERLDGVLPVQF